MQGPRFPPTTMLPPRMDDLRRSRIHACRDPNLGPPRSLLDRETPTEPRGPVLDCGVCGGQAGVLVLQAPLCWRCLAFAMTQLDQPQAEQMARALSKQLLGAMGNALTAAIAAPDPEPRPKAPTP